MVICKRCGVELDDTLSICPLCGTPVAGDLKDSIGKEEPLMPRADAHKRPTLQRVLWQVAVVLLLAAIVATLVIDASAHQVLTWSRYPVSICLIMLCYASLMGFWHTRFTNQIVAGWILSTAVLLILDFCTVNMQWLTQLMLPILAALNIVVISLKLLLRKIKRKGLNVLAILCAMLAVLCLFVDGIISLYMVQTIKLQWSIIVMACLLPVIVVLLFMFFRTRNNPDLQKIFHT